VAVTHPAIDVPLAVLVDPDTVGVLVPPDPLGPREVFCELEPLPYEFDVVEFELLGESPAKFVAPFPFEHAATAPSAAAPTAARAKAPRNARWCLRKRNEFISCSRCSGEAIH
jgi:hypothetical protein